MNAIEYFMPADVPVVESEASPALMDVGKWEKGVFEKTKLECPFSMPIKSFLKEDGGTLLLTDQTKIPISRQNREMVKARLNTSL